MDISVQMKHPLRVAFVMLFLCVLKLHMDRAEEEV